MAEYNYVVRHIKGSENVVADALSRLNTHQDKNDAVQPQEFSADDKLQLLKKVHGASSGHHGIPKTYEFLVNQGYCWTGMQDDVVNFVHACYVCQKFRDSASKGKLCGSLTTTMKQVPFESLSVDLLGPFPVDLYKNSYVLVAVDAFSRWTELRPLMDKTAESVSLQLLDIVSRYPMPKEIRSDNGGEFAASVTRQLANLLGVDQIFTIPYRPQGNGLVERCNAEVLKHLRAFLIETQSFGSWSKLLPLVQRTINFTPHVALGMSPAKLLLGLCGMVVR